MAGARPFSLIENAKCEVSRAGARHGEAFPLATATELSRLRRRRRVCDLVIFATAD
jgi:hypothetical protein